METTKGLDEKFCSSCGEIIKIAAVNCPKCGVPHTAPSAQAAEEVSARSRTVAFLLFLFFGGLGVHRFYLGKIKSGLIIVLAVPVLLFFGLSTGLRIGAGVGIILLVFASLAIWLLIDFIQIASGFYKDAQGKKVSRWT